MRRELRSNQTPDGSIIRNFDLKKDAERNERRENKESFLPLRDRDDFETDDSFSDSERRLLNKYGYVIEYNSFNDLNRSGEGSNLFDSDGKEIEPFFLYDLLVTLAMVNEKEILSDKVNKDRGKVLADIYLELGVLRTNIEKITREEIENILPPEPLRLTEEEIEENRVNEKEDVLKALSNYFEENITEEDILELLRNRV